MRPPTRKSNFFSNNWNDPFDMWFITVMGKIEARIRRRYSPVFLPLLCKAVKLYNQNLKSIRDKVGDVKLNSP